MDNALKYVEFAIKAATNSLQFEEIQNFADAMMLQRYTAVFGHLAYSLGEYQTAMLDFAENQTAMKQNAPQRVLQNVRRLFSAGVLYHGGNAWMSTLNNSVQYISVIRPRRKSCEAGQADALCILCRDVPS